MQTAVTQNSATVENENKKAKKFDKSYLPVKIIVFVLFALYAFTLFYAMLWAIGTSLKTKEEYY